ncbi:MAG: alcohol dehydrogenase catalytic domain-containing protein [Actinobacteria bacterium]|nr:alcohol dehydrogenase catalytic domain-containing protein [Actinomycetota bacterium]
MEFYKVANLIKPKKIVIEEFKKPEIESDEALIKVNYAGICGTDIAIYNGDYKVPLPLILGHEFTGEIIEAGEDVSNKLIGKRITAEINNTCLSYPKSIKCPACKKGLSTHCLERTVLGIINANGTFAQFVKVPAKNIHTLPDNISDEEGVFIEPLAAAIQTFELSKFKIGDKVIVLGVGRLGVLICSVANSLGADIIAISRSKEKLERAKSYGASKVINTNDLNLVSKVKELTDGLGADIVVESTGSEKGFNLAINLVRPRGTVALKSTHGILINNVDQTKIVVDEIRIQGSRCGPFSKAIEFLNSKKIDVKPLISEIFPLDETEEALKLAQKETKVLIKCN